MVLSLLWLIFIAIFDSSAQLVPFSRPSPAAVSVLSPQAAVRLCLDSTWTLPSSIRRHTTTLDGQRLHLEMGGGVSTNANYGDQLTMEEIKEICGGVLNEALFDCVKGPDNTVEKDKFLKIISDSMEQEILFLYFHFTKSTMNKEQYISFCAHGRLLTKNTFRRKVAEELFDEFSSDGTLNYIKLRFCVFPEIAIKKGMELQAFLVKLSRLTPPHYSDVGVGAAAPTAATEGPSGHSAATQEKIAKNIAATKIQKIQRTWLARNDLAREKELHSILSGKLSDQPSTLDRGTSHEWHHSQSFTDTDEEIKCNLLYRKYANETGEMDIKAFIRICYDTELIPFDSVNIDFTGKDAQHIFKKTVAKYFIPEENCYRPGVVHGKRVTYDVFRLRFIPEIAALKKTGIDEIVLHFAHSPGKVRGGQRANHHHHGPMVVSLLDQKHIDERLRENTARYGEHVQE
jgi:hypothetical protein